MNLNNFIKADLNSCLEDTTGYTILEINPFAETKQDIIDVINGLNEEYKADFYANLQDYVSTIAMCPVDPQEALNCEACQ